MLLTEEQAREAQQDLERYFKAMASDDGLRTCVGIEQKYGLYGYPPQIVSVALRAGAKGEDMDAAIDKALGGDEDE